MTLAEHVERVFQVSWMHCTPETIAVRRSVYDRRIKPHLGHLTMSEITVDVVEDWVNQLVIEVGRTSIMEQAFDLLKSILYLYTRRRGLANPATLIPHPRDPARPRRRARDKVITPEQYQKLLKACKQPYQRLLIRTATEAGLRIGEMAGLQRRDVNLTECTLRIERQGHSHTTKGRKGRTVAIPTSLANEFRRHMKTMIHQSDDAYIWCGRPGPNKHATDNRPYSAKSLANIIYHAQRHAGLVNAQGRPITSAHGLRATGATWNAQAGTPIHTIQHQLGHTDIRVTQESYLGNASAEGLKAYAAVFD